jgi:hypothetical protein
MSNDRQSRTPGFGAQVQLELAFLPAETAVATGAFGQSLPARPPRGSVDLDFCRALRALRAAGDPQRQRVYHWQREALGQLLHEPLLGQETARRITPAGARSAALAYLTYLWSTHATRFAPYYSGIPYLRVGFALGRRRRRRGRGFVYGAYAVPHRHEIYCRLASLRRATFVHEVCHLFTWGDGHGPAFCSALVRLWEQEFGIKSRESLALAARLRVAVDRAML